jgi:glycosyltransferase involved in cell wall biosynthesis
MPTYNRRRFVGQAIWYFLRQDYPARELIIVDDGEDAIGDLVPDDERIRYVRLEERYSVGAKRNLACELSRGELIAHWDDDDWMAPERLSIQVAELLAADADICGAQALLHYHLEAGQAWLYRPLSGDRSWLAGCTLLFRHVAWEACPFAEGDAADVAAFVRMFDPRRVLTIADPWFYIALLHSENATARNLNDCRWQRRPFDEVSQRMGADREFYVLLRNGPVVPKADIREAYAVSCIMPTYNRRPFVPQAIKYFLRQDYPRRELIVVDDGTEPVADLIADDSRIRYIRSPRRCSIGEKRNHACEIANGEVIIFWDDDDWYAPNRISYQVIPLLEGRADVTCLCNNPMLWLPTKQFWACTTELYDHMFFQGIHGGTIAFCKALWSQYARFPDTSLAEDIAFVAAAMRRGARLEKLDNANTFIYVRHNANAWQFTPGSFLDNGGWQKVEPPSFLPGQDLEFYFANGLTA